MLDGSKAFFTFEKFIFSKEINQQEITFFKPHADALSILKIQFCFQTVFYIVPMWDFFEVSREMKWRHTFQQMDFLARVSRLCNSEFFNGQ